ncbi:MAG TPA: DeoR family transcriptional regulator [Dehalococcoidia bacterium]|nr:DeoR family transcriptional regulator [Dehalococcoidia bacterium]
MQSSKQQILLLLKRAGSITVEEAAGALSLASMTARQHLFGLERDGLVQSEKVKRPTGRPHYVFRLTPKGEDLFPRRYDLLAKLLLDELGSLSPQDIEGLSSSEKRSFMIRRVAERLAGEHRKGLQGRPLDERVAATADLLHKIGGFAEWLPTEQGFEIRDYNCIFARISSDNESGCEWHVSLLKCLLDYPVTHEVVSDGQLRCCRYILVSQQTNGAAPAQTASAPSSIGATEGRVAIDA